MAGQIFKGFCNKIHKQPLLQVTMYLSISNDCQNVNDVLTVLTCCQKFKGVESADFDGTKSQVVVKGRIDAEELCEHVLKEASMEVQVVGISYKMVTAVLEFSKHCDDCVKQVLSCCRSIKGVQSAEVTTGTDNVEDKALMTVKARVDVQELSGHLWKKATKRVELVSLQEEWVHEGVNETQ